MQSWSEAAWCSLDNTQVSEAVCHGHKNIEKLELTTISRMSDWSKDASVQT